MSGSVPRRVGVIGAGTMGAGIAALAAAAGCETVLCDVDDTAARDGVARARAALEAAARRGRMTAQQAAEAEARIAVAADLTTLAGCELAIEAVPEQLALKQELLGRLAAVAPGAVLASNTSSIPIAALADGLPAAERLVGLHFFNPPTAMPLIELVAGPRSASAALATARALAEAMGKTVVAVADGPGFLVNRCARPYYLEALRLVEDGVAAPAAIDRICRLGGGFPMGPFELMDLVGIDVGLAVTRSMWDASFGEPRWRPSRLQVAMVAGGRLGRRRGGGFRAEGDAPDEPPAPTAAAPSIAVLGDDPLAAALRARARASGVAIVAAASEAELCVATTSRAAQEAPWEVPLLMSCGDASAHARRARTACGFGLVLPLEGAKLVELARGPWTGSLPAARAEALFAALGFACAWVRDEPGLVLGRIVAQLVNEAAFAASAGVAPPADVDLAMTLGLGHPRGPFAWREAIGAGAVVALLDALREQEGDPRYRVAPELRRAALAGG